MKKSMLLPVPLMGIAAAVLRWMLYRSALDDRGLLIPFHPLSVVLWILTACAAVWTLICVRRCENRTCRDTDYPRQIPGAVGAIIMALAVAFSAGSGEEDAFAVIALLHTLLRWLAAAGLIFIGVGRAMGKKPFFGCYAAASLYFALHMLLCYQDWSSNPQMHSYVFALLSCICLMLLGYHLAAFELGTVPCRGAVGFALMGFFCCCAAIPHASALLFYPAGALWCITELCTLMTTTKQE